MKTIVLCLFCVFWSTAFASTPEKSPFKVYFSNDKTVQAAGFSFYTYCNSQPQLNRDWIGKNSFMKLLWMQKSILCKNKLTVFDVANIKQPTQYVCTNCQDPTDNSVYVERNKNGLLTCRFISSKTL